MPLRALGYVASAISLTTTHLPKAEVQVVHTLHSAKRINGLNLETPRKQARQFADTTSAVLNGLTQVTHLVDPVDELRFDHEGVVDAIRTLPASIQEKLQRGGKDRGDTTAYIAAHLQMHDTTTKLIPLRSLDARPVPPKRILSIGAQSERPFYLARMAYRGMNFEIPNQVQETAQLFTRHVLSPYYMCREGEPHISQQFQTQTLGIDPETGCGLPSEVSHVNASVARDLQYVAEFLRSLPGRLQ